MSDEQQEIDTQLDELKRGGFWRWAAGAFSESGPGSPSASRTLAGVFGAASIVWISMIVHAHIRNHYEPILPDMGGLALFVSTLYGINKGSDVVGKVVSVFRTNVGDSEHK